MTSDKLDALTRAAERWGSARVDYRKDATAPYTRRMVATMRCLGCRARVAYSRIKTHIADHLKELRP